MSTSCKIVVDVALLFTKLRTTILVCTKIVVLNKNVQTILLSTYMEYYNIYLLSRLQLSWSGVEKSSPRNWILSLLMWYVLLDYLNSLLISQESVSLKLFVIFLRILGRKLIGLVTQQCVCTFGL